MQLYSCDNSNSLNCILLVYSAYVTRFPRRDATRRGKPRLSQAEGTREALDFLQSLHVVDAGNLPHSVHDFLEVFQVGDFQHHVYAGLAVLAASFYVADVGVGVADEGGDLFEHAEAVVAEKRDFDGIGNRLAVFLAGPEHVDAAVGFVEKISDVRTVDGVDGNAFAASDVSDDGLAANGVAALGTIDEQVAGPSDHDGVAVSAKDSAHNARNAAREAAGCCLLFSVGHRFSTGGREFRQHL